MGEDRKIGGKMRFSDSAEDLALSSRYPVPGTDFAKDTDGVCFRLPDENLRNLLLTHVFQLPRVEGQSVEAGAGDDRKTGLLRDLAEEVDVATHLDVARIDDASNPFTPGSAHLGRHEILIPHVERTGGRRRRRRNCLESAGPNISGIADTAHAWQEVRLLRHVLVEKSRAA